MEIIQCLRTDDWIKKLWCIYTIKYYSAIEKLSRNCMTMQFADTWIDIILNEMSQRDGDKHRIMWDRKKHSRGISNTQRQ